jgi:hypothetical protein
MIAYARLCTKVWDALPPFGSPSQFIPKDTVAFLDFVTQNWLASIPRELQLRHPRLGLAPRVQPRVLHRLRALLYLRGNHMRTLIHRPHVLNTENIMADLQSARLVVEIAQDSIQVLVHLNETSDIYARQQSAFNYFLLSPLAVILLAVCHAPGIFAEPCRESFLAATELVRGLSRRSMASRRLWRSIRGLLPTIKSLGLRRDENEQPGTTARNRHRADDADISSAGHHELAENAALAPQGNIHSGLNDGIWIPPEAGDSPDLPNSLPDIYQISNDLMGLFDAFGQATVGAPSDGSLIYYGVNDQINPIRDSGEISRRFQGLI